MVHGNTKLPCYRSAKHTPHSIIYRYIYSCFANGRLANSIGDKPQIHNRKCNVRKYNLSEILINEILTCAKCFESLLVVFAICYLQIAEQLRSCNTVTMYSVLNAVNTNSEVTARVDPILSQAPGKFLYSLVEVYYILQQPKYLSFSSYYICIPSVYIYVEKMQ